MGLTLNVSGPSGHVEAKFEKGEVRLTFEKTTPGERGMMETLLEKGKKEGMKLNTVDKKGELKPLEDEAVLESIFKAKGELVLAGQVDAVKKLGREMVDAEIEFRSVVMQAHKDGTWRILHKKEDFKEPEKDEKGEEEKTAVNVHKVPGAG